MWSFTVTPGIPISSVSVRSPTDWLQLASWFIWQVIVTYLGRVVVHAVERYPPPSTKKELQCFLGLVGYYRSFCKAFFTVVFPLTELLKACVKFVWSPECQQVFDNVKALLCPSLVLASPQLDRKFDSKLMLVRWEQVLCCYRPMTMGW